jgi:hypothetical protein
MNTKPPRNTANQMMAALTAPIGMPRAEAG